MITDLWDFWGTSRHLLINSITPAFGHKWFAIFKTWVTSPDLAYYKNVLLKYYPSFKIEIKYKSNAKLYKDVTSRIKTFFEYTNKNILQIIFDNHTFIKAQTYYIK